MSVMGPYREVTTVPSVGPYPLKRLTPEEIHFSSTSRLRASPPNIIVRTVGTSAGLNNPATVGVSQVVLTPAATIAPARSPILSSSEMTQTHPPRRSVAKISA